jgi:protein TonB
MMSGGKQTDILGASLFMAACVHAFIILGITFQPSDIGKPEFRQQSLEVMVLRRPTNTNEADEKPDFLAQTSQQGGGEEKPEVKPQISQAAEQQPLPVPQLPPPTPSLTPQPQTPQLSTKDSELKQPVTPPRELPMPPPSPEQLLSDAKEIARITAEMEQRALTYAKRPKRKSINASTKEYKYTAYLDSWRKKVERIGNLNYPNQAKRGKLYGNLMLHVAVKADGSVEQIKVIHSSGQKILDDAAIRIVRMSAPFSPFPNEIREETDILDIIRTWQFSRSGRLYAQ